MNINIKGSGNISFETLTKSAVVNAEDTGGVYCDSYTACGNGASRPLNTFINDDNGEKKCCGEENDHRGCEESGTIA